MAITKLDHLKESSKGNPAAHLKNAIRYILNPEKTEGGLYVGGSCGRNADEVYSSMMHTKEAFGKPYGRQGYHFVISFSPGECTEETAYLVGKEFCEQYFGSEYEYVYAVHNDHAHMHCHIVFNSVSQIDGRKYRYVNGDWERYVQPITDKLCEKYGLAKLVYEKDETKGESYAEHLAAKEGRFTHSDVIRADIDTAIARSGSYEEFQSIMRSMGYGIHEGTSEKHGTYLSYHAPGFSRARRDWRLGEGYRIGDIIYRIAHKEVERMNKKEANLPKRFRLPVLRLSNNPGLQLCFVLRVRQTTDWHYFAFQRKEQARVRKDLLAIDRLHEVCVYLLEHDLKSEEEVQQRLSEVQRSIVKERCRLRKERAAESVRQEEKWIRDRYRELEMCLQDPDLPDDQAEKAMDDMLEFEREYPALLLSAPHQKRSALLEGLLHERKILSGILKEAPATREVREVPELAMPHMPKERKEMRTDGRTAGDHALHQRLPQRTGDSG